MEIVEQSCRIETRLDREAIYKAIELAGRVAYKSEDKITEGSAETFIRAIRQRGHESVLEHFNITVRFITDRGVTHEIVRHRLVSYTQESTRYCNYYKRGMQIIQPVFWDDSSVEYQYWTDAMIATEDDYNKLIELGASPQEARTVLPNSLKTEIVCTANIREWRHILKLRTDKAAHPQMQALMIPLLAVFKAELPALFEDIGDKHEDCI